MKHHILITLFSSTLFFLPVHAMAEDDSKFKATLQSAVATIGDSLTQIKSKIEQKKAKRQLSENDQNENGIRDDVDHFIKMTIYNPKQISAAEQYARALQKIINSSTSNERRFKNRAQNFADAKVCVQNRFSGNFSLSSIEVIGAINEKTIDSDQKKAALKVVNNRMSNILVVPAHPLQSCKDGVK